MCFKTAALGGLDVWVEVDTDAQGQEVLRPPFSNPRKARVPASSPNYAKSRSTWSPHR